MSLLFLFLPFFFFFFFFFVVFFWFFFFFCIFRAVLAAYGGSQARGGIRVVAMALHHSHSYADPSHFYDLHHSSR